MGINQNMTLIIGLIAATLTTVSFVPQVIKTVKDKDTKSISLSMYILFTLGVFLWLCYGLLTQSLPVICANAVTFVLALVILVYKLKYK